MSARGRRDCAIIMPVKNNQALYAFTTTDVPTRGELYARGAYETRGGAYAVDTGKTLDLATYFNAFSLKKWKCYTTIQTVTVRLSLTGTFDVVVVTLSQAGETTLYQEENVTSIWQHTFPVDAIDEDILGIRLTAKTDGSVVLSGGYEGAFDTWRSQRMGAVICTYRREAFVKNLMDTLDHFAQTHDWLHVLVVDNGGTLPAGTSASGKTKTIHNRNYGGSGGFTRGMIELVERGSEDSILLMDDDIVLEPSAIERMHAMLCGLREDYSESFFAGAMLAMEKPTIQWENTATWVFHAREEGHLWDLSQTQMLVKNENIRRTLDHYGAWWFCCIPVKRIRELGYPLPNFVKCDDVEYGVRNQRPVLAMNGIGVWHMSFAEKMNHMTNYFVSRNSLIFSHYSSSCGFCHFVVEIVARCIKRGFVGHLQGLQTYLLALRDYATGYEGITAIGADERYAAVKREVAADASVSILWRLAKHMASAIKNYPKNRDRYRAFRDEKLRDARFWKAYLGIQ